MKNIGNWNYQDKSKKVILSKPLGIVRFANYEMQYKHDELIDLLELYHDCDMESVRMIEDNSIDTGEVKGCEKLFIEKVEDWIKNKKMGDEKWQN